MNGSNPVAVIFAREVTDGLTGLVKKIDAATANHKKEHMGSFAVFLARDQEAMEQKLKDLAKKDNLTHTILTVDNPAGPRGYNIAKDAAVTVILYRNKTVKANHAFKTANLSDKDVQQVLGDLPKILGE